MRQRLEFTLDSGCYTQGELAVATPRCDDYRNCDHDHAFYHATEPSAYLPHSCGEWEIGGAAEIRALIKDLTNALAIIENYVPDPRRSGGGE